MSQNQRIISVFIALCMVFAMLPMQAFAEDGDIVASGTCGDNLTWTLDSAGVLTISGTGDMTKYSSSTQPWAEHMGKIQHVIISNGVTSIGGNAFYKCSTLESIDIADTVKKIGGYAFYKCSALRTVTIPEGVSVVESRTFEDCTKLNTVELPSTLTTIEVNAFDGCTALRTCNIPESVTSIGQWAFYNCSLKDVSIPSGVKQLGNSVFYNCIFINKLMISEGVEVIGEHTFRECRNITEVTIPATVHSINACAFGGCKALNEITFVGDAPAFGSNVFLNVTSTAYYPSNNETWTEAVMQDYGGTITWVPYGDAGDDVEITITVNTTAGTVSAPEGGWKEGTNTFTVAAEKPCVVAVSYDSGATYTRLTAVATGTDNTYSFTANDMTESSIVAVIMTGDANGDGAITNADVTRLKAAYQNKVQLDSLKWLAADVNNSGDITNADVTRLKAVYQNKTSFSW